MMMEVDDSSHPRTETARLSGDSTLDFSPCPYDGEATNLGSSIFKFFQVFDTPSFITYPNHATTVPRRHVNLNADVGPGIHGVYCSRSAGDAGTVDRYWCRLTRQRKSAIPSRV